MNQLVYDLPKSEWETIPTDMDRMIGTARMIAFSHDLYRGMSPNEIGLRIDVPFELQSATVIEPGIFFSWMRPIKGRQDKPRSLERLLSGDAPFVHDWSDTGPLLWLVDVAGLEVSGVDVGRRINDYLIDREIAQDGEVVAFRRHRGRRIGWARAKRRA